MAAPAQITNLQAVHAVGDPHAVDLIWDLPAQTLESALTKYQIRVIDDLNIARPWQDTAEAGIEGVRVWGLATGHQYGFQVRAVNNEGTGPDSPTVYARPQWVPIVPAHTQDGFHPISIPDQTFTVRLGGITCRVHIRWHTISQGWYASLEAPVNTPVVYNRRLSVNSRLLSGMPSPLNGDIICSALSDQYTDQDPGFTAWVDETHALVWVPYS